MASSIQSVVAAHSSGPESISGNVRLELRIPATGAYCAGIAGGGRGRSGGGGGDGGGGGSSANGHDGDNGGLAEQRMLHSPVLADVHTALPSSTYVDPFLSVWESLWYTTGINDFVKAALDKMEKAVAFNSVFFLKMVLDMQAAYIPTLKPSPPAHAILNVSHVLRIADIFAGRLARREKESNSLSRELQLRTLVSALSLLGRYDDFKVDNDTYAKLLKHISESDWDNQTKYMNQEKVGGFGSGNYEYLVRYACDLIRSLPNDFPTFQMHTLNPISVNWLFAAGFVNQLDGFPTPDTIDKIFARISAPPSRWHLSMHNLTQQVSAAIALRYQSQAQLASSATMYFAEVSAAELASSIIGQIREEFTTRRLDLDYIFFEMLKSPAAPRPQEDDFPGRESQMVVFGLMDLLVQLAAAFPFSDNVVYDAIELARQIVKACEQPEIRLKAFELVITSTAGSTEEEYFDAMRNLEIYIDSLATTTSPLTETEKLLLTLRVEELKKEKRAAMDRCSEKMILYRGAIESLQRRLIGRRSHGRHPSIPSPSTSATWERVFRPPNSSSPSTGTSKVPTLSAFDSPVPTPGINKHEHCITYVAQTPHVPETPNESPIFYEEFRQMSLSPRGKILDEENAALSSPHTIHAQKKKSPYDSEGDNFLDRPLSFQKGPDVLQVPPDRRRNKVVPPYLRMKSGDSSAGEGLEIVDPNAIKNVKEKSRERGAKSVEQTMKEAEVMKPVEFSDSDESGEIEIMLQIPSSHMMGIQRTEGEASHQSGQDNGQSAEQSNELYQKNAQKEYMERIQFLSELFADRPVIKVDNMDMMAQVVDEPNLDDKSSKDTGTSTDNGKSKEVSGPELELEAHELNTETNRQIAEQKIVLPQLDDEKIPVFSDNSHLLESYPEKEAHNGRDHEYVRPGNRETRQSFELPLQGTIDEDFTLPIQSPDDPEPPPLKRRISSLRKSTQSPIPVDTEFVPLSLSLMSSDGADAPEPVAFHLPLAEMEAEVPLPSESVTGSPTAKKKASRRSRILAPFTSGSMLGSRRERNRSTSFRTENKLNSSIGSGKSRLPAIEDYSSEAAPTAQPPALRKSQTNPDMINEKMELLRRYTNLYATTAAKIEDLPEFRSESVLSNYEVPGSGNTTEYDTIKRIYQSKLNPNRDVILVFLASDARHAIFMTANSYHVYAIPNPFDDPKSSMPRPRFTYSLGDEEGIKKGKCPWTYCGGAASGRYIVAMMKEGIQIHDLQQSCKVIQTIPLSGYRLSAVAISGDKLVVSLGRTNGADSAIIRIYQKTQPGPKWEQWKDISLLQVAPDPQDAPHFLSLTSTAKFLAACNSAYFFAWDLSACAEPVQISSGGVSIHGGSTTIESLTSAFLFPDTNHILCSTFCNNPVEASRGGCFTEPTRCTKLSPSHSPIRQVGLRIYHSAISPNGNVVAFLSKTGQIYVVPVLKVEGDDNLTTLTPASPQEKLQPSLTMQGSGRIIFAPEGDRLVAVDRKGKVLTVYLTKMPVAA